MVHTQGYKEADIPEGLKFVHAEVLRADTPYHIARLAAGQHQRQQTESQEVTTADLLNMMVKVAVKLQKSKGSPYMTDSQLYLTLDSMGIVKDSVLKKQGRETKNPPKKEKSEEEQLVCSPLVIPPISVFFLQKEWFLSRYRQVGFMVGVAVSNNQHGALLARVADINSLPGGNNAEIFKLHLIKEYGTGLNVADMRDFISWLTEQTLQVVSNRERITNKLKSLKHYRLAAYHVLNPDPESRIPESTSMLHVTPIRCNFSFSPQGPKSPSNA